MSTLDIEYTIYDDRTRATIIVRESPDCPGVTDVVHREPDHKDERVTLRDEDLPLLIDALQRRLADSKRGEP